MHDNDRPSGNYTEALERLLAVASGERNDPASAIATLQRLSSEFEDFNFQDEELSGLLFSCSSQLINLGSDAADRAAIQAGRALAEQALAITENDSAHAWECQYNIANSLLAETDLDLPQVVGNRETWEPPLIEHRLENRTVLCGVRAQLFAICEAINAATRTRSAAACNLANMLDTSGRWAEAYTFYLRALEIRPDNGNAAGNIAQLLRFRIQTGIGQTGHLAAVHDHYVELAKSLREGTIRFAGTGAADRWDALEPTGSLGHFAHEAPEGDEYQQWVSQNRLAMSPVVEGLGTDNPRWDTAVIEQLYGSSEQLELPAIVGEMNVLKADFLVSRKLAFDGISHIENDGLMQSEFDPGYYIDTLDFALYGTQYSMLLLAQRSTLDVLDKTAVVANEYFNCGIPAAKVTFRSFWLAPSGQVRPELIKGAGRSFPSLSLAELALDMSKHGMYAASQELRNAGTHRIVHAALADATGVTRNSRSSIDFYTLLESTMLALQVTRSAYLYLVDLVASWNDPDDHPGEYIALPVYEYSTHSEIDTGSDDIADSEPISTEGSNSP